MIHPKTTIRAAWLLWMVLGGMLAYSPTPTLGQEDDPGFIGAFGIDDPSIENTYYLITTFDNDTSPYHQIYFYGEGVLGLNQDLALKASFPTLLTWDPLGKYPLGLGPIGLFLRYEAWHFGGWNSETSGAFSIQAGGSYGIHNHTFRWVGSSWSLQALGGYRVGQLFFQADWGYQGGIDPQVPNQWQFNTSAGLRLNTEWYLQGEFDVSADTSISRDSSCSFIPQIAFQPGDWFFEFGESIGDSPAGTTELMVARAF